jgi:lipopolysaccharide/colanic/teichoic acid biosynthesis glycosyltransferase
MSTLAERCVCVTALIVVLPTLAFIAFFLRIEAGYPILVNDQIVANGKQIGRALRFRTTGEGSALFRFVGRWLRNSSVDDLPAFWSITRGDIRLKDVFPLSSRARR